MNQRQIDQWIADMEADVREHDEQAAIRQEQEEKAYGLQQAESEEAQRKWWEENGDRVNCF